MTNVEINVENNVSTPALSKKELRKLRKAAKGHANKQPREIETAEQVHNRLTAESQQQINELDDYATAWEKCKQEGRAWGGRAAGGRGVNRGLAMQYGRDVKVNQVTMSFSGKVLLNESKLSFAHGHRYALIGKNGVGKTTLLRRIAATAVPGWPMHLRPLLVNQEVLGSDSVTVFGSMLAAQQQWEQRAEIEEEIEEIEARLTAGASADADAFDAVSAADRLGDLYERLERMDSGRAEVRAREILAGLQFTGAMVRGTTAALSGGWRMRLALAQALLVAPDVLLLDEPTNHLDLSAVLWLQEYLKDEANALTVVVVSHDEEFMQEACTDVIEFDGVRKQLQYHTGVSYDSFVQKQEETWARNAAKAEAAVRQRRKAEEFIAKQAAAAQGKGKGKGKKGGCDDNKARQAKQRKNKLGRVGLMTDNGHRFKLLALGGRSGANMASHVLGEFKNASNGMQSMRVKNEKAEVGPRRATVHFKFPSAADFPAGADPIKAHTPLVTMDDCRFGYAAGKANAVLSGITLSVGARSRVGIVGANGSGKSTLIKALLGELRAGGGTMTGTCRAHPGLRVAYVAQHHIDALAAHLGRSAVDYCRWLREREHGATAAALADPRRLLGQFGLRGDVVLQPIGTLSGGQKARLVMAVSTANAPHLLVLDEPTNHLDAESLAALEAGVRAFAGAVLIVSHNQRFLTACCGGGGGSGSRNNRGEMWVVRDGRVRVRHAMEAEGESFGDLFAKYKRSLTRRALSKAQVRARVRVQMEKDAAIAKQ